MSGGPLGSDTERSGAANPGVGGKPTAGIGKSSGIPMSGGPLGSGMLRSGGVKPGVGGNGMLGAGKSHADTASGQTAATVHDVDGTPVTPLTP